MSACTTNIISDHRTTVSVVLLTVLCFLSYGSSLNGSFVFDDTVAIKDNKALIQTPTNYTAIFLSDFWGISIKSKDSHKSYRPLTSLMFHMEWVQLKLEPVHMKFINLLLHSINTILIYILLQQFNFSEVCKNSALPSAVLFAVHPIHTEAVSGIVSRADLMFCFIYLICLLLNVYNRKDQWLCHILIVVLTCLGVLFKESAISIPLACVLIQCGKHEYHLLSWKHKLKNLFNKINLFYGICTAIIVTVRLWLTGFENPKFRVADNPVAHADNVVTRILSQNYLYFYNIYIHLNTLQLCFDWSFGCIKLVESILDSRLLLVFLLYLFLVMIILNVRRNFAAAMAVGLFIAPFLPASGIIKVGFVIAERVLYVPSIGFCYLVAQGFVWLCEHFVKYRKLLQMSFCLTICIFILRCRQRSAEWRTEEKLFSSALKVCPDNAKVHYNIARLATDIQNKSKAFHHYHRAIELAPDYDAALMNLGNLYRDNGDLINADKYLKQSLTISPDFATAWMNLGIVQSGLKEYKEALSSYNNALKYRKNYANCYYNLGNLYLELQQYTEALQHWRRAVTINPRLQKAWTNMLTLLDSKSMFDDAIRTSDQALKHLPRENSILFLRANVLGKQGRYMEAEQLYKQVVASEPLNYLYHTNLAVLYHRWNRLSDAVQSYRKALDANPQKAITAKQNLGKLITRLSKTKNSN